MTSISFGKKKGGTFVSLRIPPETSAPHKTDGLMRKEHHVEILTQHLKLGYKRVFQMDIKLKHSAKVVIKVIKDNSQCFAAASHKAMILIL